MRIEIRAAIFIVIRGDEMQQKKKNPSRQTNLASFGGKRPSKAKKPSKAAKVAQAPETGPKRRKTVYAIRSDKHGWHHCSRCGAAGRRRTKKLGGRCKECQYVDDEVL